jgi:sugar (pentulose or hexulose) kinase
VGFLGLGVGPWNSNTVGNISGTFDHNGYLQAGYRNIQEEAYHNSKKSHWADLFLSYCGCVEGSSTVVGAVEGYGALTEWFTRTIMSDTNEETYQKLWNSVNFDKPQMLTVTPRFHSTHGAISRMSLATTRTDIWGSIIESLTFETYRYMRVCAETRNQPVKAVRIGGGGSRSSKWNQLRADIIGLQYEKTVNREAPSLGSAILASVTTGVYSSMEEATAHMVQVGDIFKPRPGVRELFKEKLERYLND